MKKIMIVIVIITIALLTSCVTQTAIGGTSDPHGLFKVNAREVSEGRMEIASYNVILGLVTTGYPEYVAAVEAVVSQGKEITSVTKDYVFFIKTTAYAK